MIKFVLLFVALSFSHFIGFSQNILPTQIDVVRSVPEKHKVWVFIMAGQSNMAGRGTVEEEDTISNTHVYSIDKHGNLIYAKEPLHFYEPNMAGLDCGMSFALELLAHIPDSISILLLPTAVGGSHIGQWIDDERHRGVSLLSNFTEKVEFGKQVGTIKAILWHQGEGDSIDDRVHQYGRNLKNLFDRFRTLVNNESLPIIVGEIAIQLRPVLMKSINEAIHSYVLTDENCEVVSTYDLKLKEDDIHFNSESQRRLGNRYAETYIAKFLEDSHD